MAGTGFGQYIGTKTDGQLPNIKAAVSTALFANSTSGAFYSEMGSYYQSGASASLKNATLRFDASRYNPMYLDSATQVRAASLFMAYVIKY